MAYNDEADCFQQALLTDPPVKRRGALFHATFILIALAVTVAIQILGRLLIDGNAR